MMGRTWLSRSRRATAVGCCMVLLTSGCSWHGLNSLPLPGAVGRDTDGIVLHVEMANVGSLESNSPVMIDDVVVGSVGNIEVRNWIAHLDVWVKKGTVVPANAVANVGQTSLLGSSHLQLAAPLGVAPEGVMASGATIPLSKTFTYPSTEQTLSSLSVVFNAGGLGQIDEILKQFSAALGGRGGDIRSMLARLDKFLGVLEGQTQDMIDIMSGLNRLANQVNARTGVVEGVLNKLPPALDVLIAQRSNLTTALDRLRAFSDTSTGVINDTKDDLVKDLQNLEPVIRALADAGPTIGRGLQEATVFPFAQWVVDDAIKGDYANLYTTFDFRTERFRSDFLAGTRFGRYSQPLPDLVGNQPPPWMQQTDDPMGAPAAPPPPSDALPMASEAPPVVAVPPATDVSPAPPTQGSG
jgi:phospholipid/cholesterol/gamma-HCH transport system substrate-binding protein